MQRSFLPIRNPPRRPRLARLLKPVALGCLIGLLPLAGRTRAAAARLPNILLILTDDQGWWDLGVHGNKTIETPVMDQLSRDGVEFTRFYVEPVCSPTRAGLMTGRYFLRTGLYNTRFGGDTMQASEVTLAQLLQQRGYRTAIFGKWHLGCYARYHPNNRGFDEYLGFLHGHTERYDYPDALLQNHEKVTARGYITDLLTDAAINFVNANRERPFFCYLAYNVPHSPYIVGDAHGLQEEGDKMIQKYLERGAPMKSARIYAMVERCDRNIGRLLKVLDDQQLRDNTVVLFMSDNGGVHNHFKAGLKGNKGSVWEGGVRSPLFVRWPGHFPAGAKVEAIASHVDILPTVCEITGAPLPRDRVLDGRSILPLLETGKGPSPHEYVYHHWDRYFPNTTNRWAIGGQRYKLAEGKLYDLENDPGEKKDIAKAHPDLVKQMRAEFLRWFGEVTHGVVYEPVSIELGRPDENPVELQTSWATIAGKHIEYIFRTYDWDTVDAWQEPGETARWKIDVTRPGNYEVTVSYGAMRESAGSRFRLSVGDARVEGTVEATADKEVFIRRNIGTLRLKPGKAVLEVAPVKVNGPELMALNRIWLKRLD